MQTDVEPSVQYPLFNEGYGDVEAGSLGLSYAHIDMGPTIEVAQGGQLVHVAWKAGGKADPRGGKRRGEVRGFSRGSRGRLMRLVASIDTERFSKPMMVTLTYPASWPVDAPKWKYHLRWFHDRMVKRYGRFACIWRMEYQQRGAPHFHLLIWSRLLLDLQWMSLDWFEVVGSGDAKHLDAGVRCEFLRSFKGGMWYATKYAAKLDTRAEQPSPDGRHWGVWGRDLLGIVMRSYALTGKQFYQVKRFLRAIAARRGRDLGWRYRWDGMYGYLSPPDVLRLQSFITDGAMDIHY